MPGFCLAAVLCSKLAGATNFWAVSSRKGRMAMRLGLGGMANRRGGCVKSLQVCKLSSRYSATHETYGQAALAHGVHAPVDGSSTGAQVVAGSRVQHLRPQQVPAGTLTGPVAPAQLRLWQQRPQQQPLPAQPQQAAAQSQSEGERDHARLLWAALQTEACCMASLHLPQSTRARRGNLHKCAHLGDALPGASLLPQLLQGLHCLLVHAGTLLVGRHCLVSALLRPAEQPIRCLGAACLPVRLGHVEAAVGLILGCLRSTWH